MTHFINKSASIQICSCLEIGYYKQRNSIRSPYGADNLPPFVRPSSRKEAYHMNMISEMSVGTTLTLFP